MAPLEDDAKYKLGLIAGGFDEFKSANEREHQGIGASIGQLRDSFLERLDKMEDRLSHKIGDSAKSHGACREEIDGRLDKLDGRLSALELERLSKKVIRHWWARSWQYVVGGVGFLALLLGILGATQVL